MAKRLFVALMPPRAALDELSAAVRPLRADAPSARWTRIDSWHLTLAFLGAVEAPMRNLLVEELERVSQRHPPIQLSITGAGHFGNRVLWGGIAGDRERLRRLADSVRAAARQVGVDLETQSCRGHLTLARGAAGLDLTPLVERLREFAGSVWTATELYLVESRLGVGLDRTAPHESYARWPLNTRASG